MFSLFQSKKIFSKASSSPYPCLDLKHTYNLLFSAYDANAFEYVVHQLMIDLSIPIITETVVATCVSACTQGWSQGV